MFAIPSRSPAPPIDADEEKQPYNVNKMPVPGCCFETEMMLGLEMTRPRPEKAHDQEAGSNDNVEAVEARRHEEGRAVYPTCEGKSSMGIFVGLQNREADAQTNSDRETVL